MNVFLNNFQQPQSIKEILFQAFKSKSNRHKVKICGKCGQEQSDQWIRHWKRKDHQGIAPFEAQIQASIMDVNGQSLIGTTFNHEESMLLEAAEFDQFRQLEMSYFIDNQLANDSTMVSKAPKLFECDQCHKSFILLHNLQKHLRVNHNSLKQRDIKTQDKEKIYVCEYCTEKKYLTWRRFREHLWIIHQEKVFKPKKTIEPKSTAEERLQLKKESNKNKVCLTGSWKERALWNIFLVYKGFEVSERPSNGSKALIVGNFHNQRLPVELHWKYQRAAQLNVPMMYPGSFLDYIGVSDQQFSVDISQLRQEIKCSKLGPSNDDVRVWLWQGAVRFITVSPWAHQALSVRKYSSETLKSQNGATLFEILQKYLIPKASIEIYQVIYHVWRFVGKVKLDGDSIKVFLFEKWLEPLPSRKSDPLISVLNVSTANLGFHYSQEQEQEQEQKQQQEEEKIEISAIADEEQEDIEPIPFRESSLFTKLKEEQALLQLKTLEAYELQDQWRKEEGEIILFGEEQQRLKLLQGKEKAYQAMYRQKTTDQIKELESDIAQLSTIKKHRQLGSFEYTKLKQLYNELKSLR